MNNNPTNSLSGKILDRIEKENIQPASRLRMRLQTDGFWILWFFSILIGAAAVAGTLFVFLHNDWKFYSAVYDNFLDFIFDTLPYIWFLTVVVFILLAHQNVRHTKYGYRYPFGAIILLSVLSSLIVGVCLYVIGLGNFIDQDVGGYIPLHSTLIETQESRWNQPEKGLLAGTLTYVAPDFSSFEITSFDGHKWRLGAENLEHIDLLILSENTEVRVVGIAETHGFDPDLFHPCLVLPWMKPIGQYENERNILDERNNICKGVRPYELLKELQRQA